MYRAEIDREQNLLRISYAGRVTAEETKRWPEELEPVLAEVQPGFRLLTDLTGLESMEPGCIPHINAAMDLCDRKGVALVVRVIPDPQKDIGLSILSLFHYHRRVHSVTCASMAEGWAVLDSNRESDVPVSD